MDKNYVNRMEERAIELSKQYGFGGGMAYALAIDEDEGRIEFDEDGRIVEV